MTDQPTPAEEDDGSNTTTVFCVDVETTSTHPTQGDILTIGCAVSRVYPRSVLTGPTFYVRVGDAVWRDDNTSDWWAQQASDSPDAYAEIFGEKVRHPLDVALAMFTEFVETEQPNQARRVLAASPVWFDAGFIDAAYARCSMPNPFGYRHLDVRSMHIGRLGQIDLTGQYRGVPSTVPHHALHDAIALAEQFRSDWRIMGVDK